MTSIELCAGGGGQAIGLEKAGFDHLSLVEIDHHACETLRLNRPEWRVEETDLRAYSTSEFYGKVDLLAGGVPCPPFSVAGKQLGEEDERNLFDEALRLVKEADPRAVMLENVRGLLDPKFQSYREKVGQYLTKLGYWHDWRLLNASDYGVVQLRPRVVLVAVKKEYEPYFKWPVKSPVSTTVGNLLVDLMGENGWPYAEEWSQLANDIAPTLVGGSKKHGGPDLGPTRAKRAWRKLHVNGTNVMYEAPEHDFVGKEGYEMMPYLSLRMTARVQGFPDSWDFFGTKTHVYRQIGNAFPAPVAQCVAESIASALRKEQSEGIRDEQLEMVLS